MHLVLYNNYLFDTKIKPAIPEAIRRLEQKVSESNLAWFISFLKKEHRTREDFFGPPIGVPTFKEVSEFQGLGFLIALYDAILASQLPLYLNLKVDILSQWVFGLINKHMAQLDFVGRREIGRIKKANLARMKAI